MISIADLVTVSVCPSMVCAGADVFRRSQIFTELSMPPEITWSAESLKVTAVTWLKKNQCVEDVAKLNAVCLSTAPGRCC